MFIADDLKQFKELFINSLKNMLSDDELGAFILVLANSLQDDFIKAALSTDLKLNFQALKEKYETGKLVATQDDLDVFNQLKNLDIDGLPVWQSRQLDHWQIVFNKMRELRPTRTSSQKLDSIIQPFKESSFHFNKAFLNPEILWQGEYNNKRVKVLFNKFPFCDYHFLIVVSPESNLPQVIDEKIHHYIYSLVQEQSKDLPGFGVGFNSLAAGASVNHLHFQGFIRQQPFPVESHVAETYPLDVYRCHSSEHSWQVIQNFMTSDTAFNCLYRSDCCYVVPRLYQASVELPDWLNGAGWIDVAGVMTVSGAADIKQLSAAKITQGMRLLTL